MVLSTFAGGITGSNTATTVSNPDPPFNETFPTSKTTVTTTSTFPSTKSTTSTSPTTEVTTVPNVNNNKISSLVILFTEKDMQCWESKVKCYFPTTNKIKRAFILKITTNQQVHITDLNRECEEAIFTEYIKVQCDFTRGAWIRMDSIEIILEMTHCDTSKLVGSCLWPGYNTNTNNNPEPSTTPASDWLTSTPVSDALTGTTSPSMIQTSTEPTFQRTTHTYLQETTIDTNQYITSTTALDELTSSTDSTFQQQSIEQPTEQLPEQSPEPMTSTEVPENTSTLPLTETAMPSTKPMCLCPCDCNATSWSTLRLEKLMEDIREEMALNVTSQQIRRLNSASDKRLSSRSIGFVGILIMTITLLVIMIGDTKQLMHDAKVLFQKIRTN